MVFMKAKKVEEEEVDGKNKLMACQVMQKGRKDSVYRRD